MEDNPAPEPEDTPRGGDCSTGSIGSENSEGSEAGDTPEEDAMGVDDRCTTSMSAASDTDTGPGTRIRPGIGIDIGIGIGIGIDIGIDIDIDIGIDIGMDIGIDDGPGVFVAEPEGLAVPCR